MKSLIVIIRDANNHNAISDVLEFTPKHTKSGKFDAISQSMLDIVVQAVRSGRTATIEQKATDIKLLAPTELRL